MRWERAAAPGAAAKARHAGYGVGEASTVAQPRRSETPHGVHFDILALSRFNDQEREWLIDREREDQRFIEGELEELARLRMEKADD